MMHEPMTDVGALEGLATLVVRKLTLTRFRSYEKLSLEVGPQSVILTGANGAGKTNILEALSLLAPGRGLRQAGSGDFLNRGQKNTNWGIYAHLENIGGIVEIGTGHNVNTPKGRRKVRINGEQMSGQSRLASYLHVVWLTPRMDRIFVDSASTRRGFFDRLVSGFDVEHGRRVASYQRCMRERMEMLRQSGPSGDWLEAIEQTMSEHAVSVSAARCDALRQLTDMLQTPYDTAFPKIGLSLEGPIEAWLDDTPAVVVEERVRAALAADRLRDRDSGRTAFGPHKTELLVRHLGHDLLADQCSTGEQKMLLLSIVLAHTQVLTKKFNRPPLILLDEVMAHLDEDHRRSVIEVLCFLGVQVWLTGVDPALFSGFGDRAQFLNITNGIITDCNVGKLA